MWNTVITQYIIPLLFMERPIRDKNGNLQVLLQGILAKKLLSACKSFQTWKQLIHLVQSSLSKDGFRLTQYQFNEQLYLTAVPYEKLRPNLFLDDNEAFVLGIIITIQRQENKAIKWAKIQKIIDKTGVKIKNSRQILDNLILYGLIWKKKRNPLIINFGPRLILEFTENSLITIQKKIEEEFLV
ncbi:MAG: hypothetical protein IH859_07090 [Chloroflexi bacterium]|nr:hypothetical protein [Chloroflexota bacterium]